MVVHFGDIVNVRFLIHFGLTFGMILHYSWSTAQCR